MFVLIRRCPWIYINSILHLGKVKIGSPIMPVTMYRPKYRYIKIDVSRQSEHCLSCRIASAGHSLTSGEVEQRREGATRPPSTCISTFVTT